MTDASMNAANMQEAGKKSLWFVALGVIVFLLGALAAANLFVATVVSVLFVGGMMIAAGIAEIVHAFSVKTWGSFFLWILTGVMYTIAGILTFYNPLLTTSILTLFIAMSLIAAGLVRIWAGISQRRSNGWAWMVAGGILTLLVGVLVLLRWPVNSLWVIGIFLAVDLMFQGVAYFTYGLGMRRHPAVG